MANDPKDKKDLTGILDLQKLQAENPEAMADVPVDPFAVNELQKIEQVDHFDSIDQIGMMDHPEPVEELAAPAATEDPFAVNTDTNQFPVSEPTPPAEDPFAVTTDFQAPLADEVPASTEFSNDFTLSAAEPTTLDPAPFEEKSFEETPVETPPPPSLNKLKNYSEKSQGKTNLEIKIHYPFHLKINGSFGPYERDKLLIFITENPIGLSSGDLDLQITSGRVLLPRISEYAAIKLVQELRDSGLEFKLHPSERESDETTSSSASLSYRYEAQNSVKISSLKEIPILTQAHSPQTFQELDEVSIVQYVRTEVLEVESSPMIQEVIERMTEALKQKARLKGGNALLGLKQEILPLRLPSQYQISLKASVVKI